jgi:membrane carboxypeptidase/penicillin-binding protein
LGYSIRSRVFSGIRAGIPFTPAYRMNLNEGTINGWTPADHTSGVILPRTGLAASSNRGALVVGNMIGMDRGCQLEHLAFSSSAECSPQILLGGGENNTVAALAVAEAYAAFANGGDHVAARFTMGAPIKRQRLFSAEAAFVTTQLLRSAIGDSPAVQATIGNGKRLAGLPPSAELAGKTGSTDSTLWIAVIHPRLVVVVAAGTDDNRKVDGLFGGAVARAVWAKFVRESLPVLPWYFEGHFARPRGVQERRFNPDLGCLTETGAAREFFLTNRIPNHCD